MKTHTRVAVIGGGVTGCSILYHLAKAGWSDVVLIERQELTAGSSWHAAGNLFALTSPNNVSWLQKYAQDIYPTLEQESEQSVGYHPVGGITLIANQEEMDSFKITVSRGRRLGIDAHFMDWTEVREHLPFEIDGGRLAGALWDQYHGFVDPASVTQAYAKAARRFGAEVYRHNPVLETNALPNGGWQIVTQNGTLEADYVVNAAGLWAREVASLAGIELPLAPVQHHYLVTEDIAEIAGMQGELPTIGFPAANSYFRREGQGLLFGAYEKPMHHWAVDGTPLDFGHELLPDNLEWMEDNFALAAEVMPVIGSAGIKRVVNGPMIFSPDLGPLVGPYPGLCNYFCACGVMTGFNQGAGIGLMLAQWIMEGEPGMDINCWDVARYGGYANRDYTLAKTRYWYEHRQDRVYPYQEIDAGRPLAKRPAYDIQAEAGAVFGEAFGWEHALWYARPSDDARDIYSFRRGNWHDAVGEECRATGEGVGIFDVSTFAKYRVSGSDAEAWLNHVLANRMPVPGKTTLSPMLSNKGRVIGDFTVTNLGPDGYLLLGAGSMQMFHQRHFANHIDNHDVNIENQSAGYAGFMIAGPNARTLLQSLTEEDVSADGFRFLSGRIMSVAGISDCYVVRVSFTGELGYEVYCGNDSQQILLEKLLESGPNHGARLCGSRALMSMRLEKAFPSWGSDLSPDYNVFETGLDRFVKFDKANFIGRETSLELQRQPAGEQRLLLRMDDTGADPSGGEAVFAGDEHIGYVTSGGFGHRVQASLALAYLKRDKIPTGGTCQVEILGEMVPASIHGDALVDPSGGRMRG